jgi:hypothetical protein
MFSKLTAGDECFDIFLFFSASSGASLLDQDR